MDGLKLAMIVAGAFVVWASLFVCYLYKAEPQVVAPMIIEEARR